MPELSADQLKQIGAISTAIASIIATVISLYFSRCSGIRIAQLKSELDRRNKELDARRDYEYGALKRLYMEYEPLRFLLIEASESARKVIGQIAKVAYHKNENESVEIGAICRWSAHRSIS
jgi:formylmethanofuran dehydrogenase subunit E-like metal-binding protein